MTPIDFRTAPTISFTQLDQYLRCSLRYRLIYIDHLQPDFVPAARAFGSGIHVAAASFFRAVAKGETPAVDALQESSSTASGRSRPSTSASVRREGNKGRPSRPRHANAGRAAP